MPHHTQLHPDNAGRYRMPSSTAAPSQSPLTGISMAWLGLLSALPCELLKVVSRFLMPRDANCLVRSFKMKPIDDSIDWLKVLFNYARIEALHHAWCCAVGDLPSAKAFYINHKANPVTDHRVINMFKAIYRRNLSDLQKDILECPGLLYHMFTTHDSTFPCTAGDHPGLACRVGGANFMPLSP